MSQLRIAIATVGRFHVLDLARELAGHGHDVAFYSMLPLARAVRFGLPPGSHRDLFRALWPIAAAQRFGGNRIRDWLNPRMLGWIDRLIASRLEPCDIFIGMSGLCIESARVARRKFGAVVFIERGSRHIRSQKAILDDIARRVPGAATVPAYAIHLHERSAEVADYITVPSRHVADSHVSEGLPASRLFLNPYGVDLRMFPSTAAPSAESATALFAGNWSYRKGCDVLARAISAIDGRVRLLHVGPVGDAPLPDESWFTHIGPVPQWQLSDIYARADVAVLASREEGLALVQAQALSCGLPLVCTDRTGGADLRDLLHLDREVSVVPCDDHLAFAEALVQTSKWARQRFPPGSMRDLLGNKRGELSWTAYGSRYSDKVESAHSERIRP